LEKFHHLGEHFEHRCEIVCTPCAGLAGRIEQGNLDAPDLHELLVSLVGDYAGKVDGVVLGCTHYPFVREQIRAVLGDVPFFDGAAGTARQTRRLLEQRGLLRTSDEPGSVSLASSLDTPETLALYRRLLVS
jgi:glutamate racemase